MTVPLPTGHGFSGFFTADQMRAYGAACRADERERCCAIVFGQCDSDNVAQRTVEAIRNMEQPK